MITGLFTTTKLPKQAILLKIGDLVKCYLYPAMVLWLLASNSYGQTAAVYLSCDLASSDGKPARHFDFTLNEANSTVSYYVREANSVNIERAVFGPTSVIWSSGGGTLVQTVRVLDRTSLTFTEVVAIAANVKKEAGTCKVVTSPDRKF